MKKTSTMLKLAAATLAMGVMAGCASQASEEQSGQMSQAQTEATETRSMAREALTTAQQAQRTAQQALQLAQQNRQEMDRMFERSMRK
ncbi:Lpp/OprI family alanine-zipper lipoprotein [Halomonas sp. McH1-25]|uniref:Lpp/OprI family alanine-zipper lipoprotein n=1 Tax=unclassified Halomonas TaxID=2609666 RepID=UPI001EF616F6|nr:MULTISPECIES: Lpp/OprI family alanine-zipper lipoprotein [unclassified Halomonas]MCG7599066.1 Lpp/OprI family alanine-zipper lipoprotein [Halomonas sp. McH1-25]MCP1342377.1 Lpp/OprI family alanine-zipper lipoprotein [Halomonas sp. FL8]MCP1360369.1 Lpp/OprI family alanine-zipper lipoprotein [Halomonas sp. BBD45]MCP1364636.1 Lpp/OprI family alanine-zipper lipoprotein [Halomonas sp. BBD48]